MDLKTEHKQILAECLRRQAMLPKKAPSTGGYLGHYDERIRQARRGVALAEQVEYGPAWSSVDWFGAHTAAQQKRYSRAVRALHEAGLVVATGATGARVQWLRLTAEGERLARELAFRKGQVEAGTPQATGIPGTTGTNRPAEQT